MNTETKLDPNETFKYCFTIYEANGEKFHTDYYNEPGAKQMAERLWNDNIDFAAWISDLQGSLNEVSTYGRVFRG